MIAEYVIERASALLVINERIRVTQRALVGAQANTRSRVLLLGGTRVRVRVLTGVCRQLLPLMAAELLWLVVEYVRQQWVVAHVLDETALEERAKVSQLVVRRPAIDDDRQHR